MEKKEPNWMLFLVFAGLAFLLTTGKINLPFNLGGGSNGGGQVAPSLTYADTLGATAVVAPHLVGQTASEDAKILQVILAEEAGYVQRDGLIASPILTERYQAANLLAAVAKLSFAGKTKSKYESLGPAIKLFAETHFGTKQGPLTPQDRAKLVEVLGSLSAAFGKVT